MEESGRGNVVETTAPPGSDSNGYSRHPRTIYRKLRWLTANMRLLRALLFVIKSDPAVFLLFSR